MCFRNRKESSEDWAPNKLAQPPPQIAASSIAPPAKVKMDKSDYAPPPGPPPGHSHAYSAPYTSPPGPPPAHRAASANDYAPPVGPPPGHDYAPPAGPPPPRVEKQHEWKTAVPDTALLPPPPSFFSGWERSPANNSTEDQAEAGEQWVRQYPMYQPLALDAVALNAIAIGNINMFAPPNFEGALAQVDMGVWKGHSRSGAPDTCLATYPPLYSVHAHSPLATGRKKTIYFEVTALQDSRSEISFALGFVAPPYPAFRLPGWHRGSLAVHGDDGHRYVNDRWGGKSFTTPFKRGETVGLGMDLIPGAGDGIAVDIFHTKEGREIGRWELHEESDREQDLPVTGLEGFHDLAAAVGMFDKVSFEIVFAPGRWKWQGYQG